MLCWKKILCQYRYKIRYCCFCNLWKFQQFKSIPYSINSHTTKHWNNIATRLNGWDHIVVYDCCFQCTKINDHCWGNYFPKGSYKVLPIRLMYTSYSIDITFPSWPHLAWQIAQLQYQGLTIKMHVDRSSENFPRALPESPISHLASGSGLIIEKGCQSKCIGPFLYSWNKNG